MMPIRRFVFWTHLACGLTAGLVILLMSVTGTLLTYEKQMIQWSDRQYWIAPSNQASNAPSKQASNAPLEQVVANAQAYDASARVAALVVYSNPNAPIAANLGGGRALYLDPSTGQVLGENTTAMRDFFGAVKSWHRWLGVEGDARNRARAVTGWSNMIFLFMVLSGLYLWVPKKLSWQHLRPVVLFNRKATGKARDFNWHHVFGFWLSIPLALVIVSATFISFAWVSDWALDRVAVEAPAQPGQPALPAEPHVAVGTAKNPASLDQLLDRAVARVPGWRTVSLNLLTPARDPIQFQIDRGWGGEPTKQSTLTLDRMTGREVSYETFDGQAAGRRMRLFFRFAHTGEFYGVLGQSIAGIASLAGVLLVWSGFALAWRRLVRPLFKKRSRPAQ